MSPYVEFAKLRHMVNIKQYHCPDCNGKLDRAMSPGGATGSGETEREFTHWDFHCQNEECSKIWRVSRALYEAAFGE